MRIKTRETAIYHITTRIVAGERLLGPSEKEVLRKMLWRVASFSGVEIVAYCIMTNHLHILLRVPEAREEELTRDELLRRYRVLYGDGRCGFFPDPDVMETILADEACDEAARWEARLRVRMNDVSAFMKTLKHRFSWWYNKSHQRFGTLWAERFKSVLVEDAPHALQVVAAYIDLNPVRAGIVEDPGDYRWSSYGEAIGGEASAQEGLAYAVGRKEWAEAASDYRMVLFGKGAHGRHGEQAGIPRERVVEVLEAGGKVSAADLLRCKLRYMSEGAILGSEEFVRSLGEKSNRRSKKERKRKREKLLGELPIKDLPLLRTWRNLRKNRVE